MKQFHRDNPEGRIVLLGYSAGGHDAIELANRLGREKIGVNPFRGSPLKNATNYDLTGRQIDHVTIVTEVLKKYPEIIEDARKR